jgi:hypothetical protein
MYYISWIHYVTLNGFVNHTIICWYIICYELFVLNFIIKMYYVLQNKSIFLIFFFIWTKYEKDNDDFFKKEILLTCIEMQDLHAIFFNSSSF